MLIQNERNIIMPRPLRIRGEHLGEFLLRDRRPRIFTPQHGAFELELLGLSRERLEFAWPDSIPHDMKGAVWLHAVDGVIGLVQRIDLQWFDDGDLLVVVRLAESAVGCLHLRRRGIPLDLEGIGKARERIDRDRQRFYRKVGPIGSIVK
jgi:hypothetical protein